ETVGLPFSYLRNDIAIAKTRLALPVTIDSFSYGFTLRFRSNIMPGKPIYYTLQTKDSVQRSGIVQVDGNGLIEIGGNSFY
ncbi:hypothetical protein, partial [Listeria monocytogenes]|uniref:hypothetical protein n=1 Tax=Listeria monocytogenes TaxID=1639 RepID=UPI003FA46B66